MNKLTTKEFRALERNADGDIIRLSEVFYRLTEGQKLHLSSDDFSRLYDLEEELAILWEEAKREFGH
jgi:hypothetical protein